MHQSRQRQASLMSLQTDACKMHVRSYKSRALSGHSCEGNNACLMAKRASVQVGPDVLIGLQQEAAEVRSQMSALKDEAGALAAQVGPAVAALLAAKPPYQPPPQEDKVTDQHH